MMHQMATSHHWLISQALEPHDWICGMSEQRFISRVKLTGLKTVGSQTLQVLVLIDPAKHQRIILGFEILLMHARYNTVGPALLHCYCSVDQRCKPINHLFRNNLPTTFFIWKLWGVLGNAMLTALSLAVKWLYSCSDVCVRVGGVKLQPLGMIVELWQEWLLSPLVFIV